VKRVSQFKLRPVDEPAAYEELIRAGLRALEAGTATAHQQQAVLTWIIKEASGVGNPSFRPDPYSTAFAEGRRFVAIQIIDIMVKEAIRDGN
jgi:hypothetical protein